MAAVQFRKKVVGVVNNEFGSYPMNTFSCVGDVNQDGWVDIVISGREGRMVWLENPGKQGDWIEHVVDGSAVAMECGGSLVDLTGSGFPDIINGGGGIDEIWWWKNPGTPEGKWQRSTILKTGSDQFHDTLVAVLPPYNRPALLFTNQNRQKGTTLYCVPLPANPHISPWPDVTMVSEGKFEELVGPDGNFLKMQSEEGIAVGDLDGDGVNEIAAGTWWFKWDGSAWVGHKFAKGYVTNKIAIGDVNGDSKNEIILSEGDPVIYGKTQGGKAAWFAPAADPTQLWEEHVLAEGLLDAHTLAVGNITGHAAPDIVVGEIGVASQARGYARRLPCIYLFENDGKGHFTRHLIDEGTGIHDGVLVDVRHTGRLDLVGKPLHGPDRWCVVVFENETV